MSIRWERQEPGWYTSRLGALVLEIDGWWWFWAEAVNSSPDYRWRTLREAKRGVARLAFKP